MFIQHNQIVKDLTLKIYLQQDAIKALPPDLAALALVTDEEPPPRNRPYPIYNTPPIPGIDVGDDPDRDKDEIENVAVEPGHYITDKYTTDDENADMMRQGDEEEQAAGGKKKSYDSDDDYGSEDETEY